MPSLCKPQRRPSTKIKFFPLCLYALAVFFILVGCAAQTPAPIPTATPIPRGGEVPVAQYARGSTWTTGAKLGVGTAYTYEHAAQANPSRVWFTITNGALTDVLYPTLDSPNVRELKFLVSDGQNIYDETADLEITIARPDPQALLWEITSTDHAQRFRLTKTIVADPDANALLVAARLDALEGNANDYQLYVYFTPLLNGTGKANKLTLNFSDHRATVTSANTAATIGTDVNWLAATAGYLRANDSLDDLKTNKKLTMDFDSATQGDYPTLTAQLPSDKTITLALGLGANADESQRAASDSLARGFNAVRLNYIAGWHRYTDSLDPSPSSGLNIQASDEYYLSAMLLRAAEDKTYRGAVVASFAIPWGDQVLDDPSDRANFAGYRRVWARDAYHIAMGLLAAGDRTTALAILNYLDNVQQLPTGAFPQNSYLDGSPSWTGLQIDEVADPILLAWWLDAPERYASLVKPAADYILQNGPSTPQERWEEASGYSPATVASEIAALLTAADLADRAGDGASAREYRFFANRWAMELPLWTYTNSGTLGAKQYFIRLAPSGKPDDKELVTLGGGVNVDQRALVDPSFLELVRLGIMQANEPLIVSTLNIVDQKLRVETPNGSSFHRYPGDRYGEHDRGPFILDKGHLWTLLTGERGMYELAAGHLDSAEAMLSALGKFANAGGMIPEQVWEDSGDGTGSATPLLWSHAEYILLLKSIASGNIIDRPGVVTQGIR